MEEVPPAESCALALAKCTPMLMVVSDVIAWLLRGVTCVETKNTGNFL
jgi:hypothetical protein